MTDFIRNAFGRIRGLFQNTTSDENRNSRPKLTFTSGYKRPFSSPDLTDDEDEEESFVANSPVFSSYQSKRVRTTSDDNVGMSGSRDNYMARSSGLTPKFKSMGVRPLASSKLSQKTWEKGFEQPSTSFRFQQASRAPPTARGNPFDRINRRLDTSFDDLGKSSAAKKPEIEVVTLDDEEDNEPSTSTKEQIPPRSSIMSRITGKCVQKRVSSPKASISTPPSIHKAKHRFSALGRLNAKLNTPDPKNVNPVRLGEKARYLQLLMDMNIVNQPKSWSEKGIFSNLKKSTVKPLVRSKMPMDELRATYSRRNESSSSKHTSPYVTIDRASKPRNEFAASAKILDHAIRLYSTPSTSKASPKSPTEAYFDKPGEFFTSTPYRTKKFPSLFDAECNRSFADLDEALGKVKCLEKSGPDHSKDLVLLSDSDEDEKDKNASTRALPSTSKQGQDEYDDDIVVLSESIISKPKSRLSSLKLEHTAYPEVEPEWLEKLHTSWKESQDRTKKAIKEESVLQDVLRNESTLEQDLRTKLRNQLKLTSVIVLEELPPELPEIDDEMRAVINHATMFGPENEVLATVFKMDITRGDIKTLAPMKWLNDNIINSYMELIAARSKQGEFPKVHVFTTFFYPKLQKEGYSNILKRWTRKVDIFSNDLILFPIHLGLHWCLAVADLRKKELRYYDSLGGSAGRCLHLLLNYLSSEMKERKQELLDESEWTLETVEEINHQQNGSDCGMFTCKFAEFISRDASLKPVRQDKMNYYRERMIYEIIKMDLLYP